MFCYSNKICFVFFFNRLINEFFFFSFIGEFFVYVYDSIYVVYVMCFFVCYLIGLGIFVDKDSIIILCIFSV